jgi:type I restriction enzyme S subunit
MASVKDMHSWGIDLKSCRKISHEDFEKLENGDCRPKQGDVLIAKDGSYLKHVFVAEDNAPYVLLSSIAILRPNERIKSNQLAMFLGLPQTKKRLTGYVSGVALPRIILKEFRRFSFLCPPIKLQEVWADNYDCIFDLCRNLIQENEKLAKARDLLLPKLMNGEIAV